MLKFHCPSTPDPTSAMIGKKSGNDFRFVSPFTIVHKDGSLYDSMMNFELE